MNQPIRSRDQWLADADRGESVRTMSTWKLLLAGALCLAAASASAQQVAKASALPPNPPPGAAAPASAQQLPAAPNAGDLQACLQETGDYVTIGRAVIYVIVIANTCDKRLRCEIFANVTGAKGSSLGHTIMTLDAADSGAAAKQTYSMRVSAAGGIAQVSRDCKVL
jgi:hypothetical protein